MALSACVYLLKVDKSNGFPFTHSDKRHAIILTSWSISKCGGRIGTWTLRAQFWFISTCTYFKFVLGFHCKYHLTHKHARAHERWKRNGVRMIRPLVCLSYPCPQQISFSSKIPHRIFARKERTISHITVTCDCLSLFGVLNVKKTSKKRQRNESYLWTYVMLHVQWFLPFVLFSRLKRVSHRHFYFWLKHRLMYTGKKHTHAHTYISSQSLPFLFLTLDAIGIRA